MKRLTSLLIVIIVMLTFTLVGCNKDDVTPIPSNSEFGVTLSTYYIGTSDFTSDTPKFLLSYIFDDTASVEYSIEDSSIATCVNNELTILKEGATIIKATGKADTIVSFIDGINVYSDEDFLAAIDEQIPAVLHTDIKLIDVTNSEYARDNNKYGVNANIYGNAHIIDCSPVLGDDNKPQFDPAFKLRSSGVFIFDTHFVGHVIEDGDDFHLGDLVDSGVLFDVEGTDSFVTPSVTFKNCAFENANRLVNLISCDATIDNCCFRNAAEACVSVGTYETGGSSISIKDCTMELAASSCIIVYDDGEVDGVENKAVITLSGTVDFDNWKTVDSVQLVPSYETLASLMNDRIRNELSKSSNASMLTVANDGASYIHLAILILTKGDGYPDIVGATEQSLVKRTVPSYNYDYYGYDSTNPIHLN